MRCESLSLTSVTVEELPPDKNDGVEFRRTASPKRSKKRNRRRVRDCQQPIHQGTTCVPVPSTPRRPTKAPGESQKRDTTAKNLHRAFIRFSFAISTERRQLASVPHGGIHSAHSEQQSNIRTQAKEKGRRGKGSCWILGHKKRGRGIVFTLCGEWEGGGEVKKIQRHVSQTTKIQRFHPDDEVLFTGVLVKTEVWLWTVLEMSSSCGKCQKKKERKKHYNCLPGSV